MEAVPACMRSSMVSHANNKRHMRARAAGACKVLENLVLVARVYDNGRLQLPCFGDHASLETRPPVFASR
jgi:hypothetical protein